MNSQRKHLVAFFALVLFIAMSITITADDEEKVKYRSDVLKELAKVEAAFNQSTNDEALRKEYAKLLFQTGDFWKAKETVSPLFKKSKDVETLVLGARLTYMMGDYKGAEELNSRVIKIAEKGSKEYNSAVEGHISKTLEFFLISQCDPNFSYLHGCLPHDGGQSFVEQLA